VEVAGSVVFRGETAASASVSIPGSADGRARGKTFILDRAVVSFKRQIEEEEHTKASSQASALIYYEKKISDHLLFFAQETVRKLITSKEIRVELEDVAELTNLFKFDTGIRLFCFLLKLEIPKALPHSHYI